MERLDTLLRTTPRAAQAQEWSTVLAASGIPHRLALRDEGWVLAVDGRDVKRAGAALAAYEDENRDEGAVVVPTPVPGAVGLGVALAALLLAFFLITGSRTTGSPWFERGSASAERILSGEAWRTVTAITLHADLGHALGNATACAVLISAVANALGPGTGVWVLLLGAATANVLTAIAHGPPYSSVGASTVAFAAIGVLASQAFMSRWSGWRMRRRAWAVVVASLLLLLLTGTAAGSDVLGHSFGLLTGAALGVAVWLARRRPFPPVAEWTLTALALSVVIVCWLIALA